LAKFHQKKETLVGFNFSLSGWIHFAFLEQASKEGTKSDWLLLSPVLVMFDPSLPNIYLFIYFRKNKGSTASNLIFQNFNS
jgi:hypothetical protein